MCLIGVHTHAHTDTHQDEVCGVHIQSSCTRYLLKMFSQHSLYNTQTQSNWNKSLNG